MSDISEDALGLGKARMNSKAKGNRGELVAAKFMSKWVGTKFARTPGSGALRWINAAMVCGDLTLEDQTHTFPYTVEIKSYKSADLTLSRVNSKVFTFWKQAEEDAKRAGKIPMLLVRTNGMPKGEFMVYVEFNKASAELIRLPAVVGGGLIGYESKCLLEFIKFSTFDAYQNKS